MLQNLLEPLYVEQEFVLWNLEYHLRIVWSEFSDFLTSDQRNRKILLQSFRRDVTFKDQPLGWATAREKIFATSSATLFDWFGTVPEGILPLLTASYESSAG